MKTPFKKLNIWSEVVLKEDLFTPADFAREYLTNFGDEAILTLAKSSGETFASSGTTASTSRAEPITMKDIDNLTKLMSIEHSISSSKISASKWNPDLDSLGPDNMKKNIEPVHPTIERALNEPYLGQLNKAIDHCDVNLTLPGPHTLTVLNGSGIRSRKGHIGGEVFNLQVIFAGKGINGPRCIFKPEEKTLYQHVEMPLDEAISVFGRDFEKRILQIIADYVEFVEEPIDPKLIAENPDFGSW